MGSNLQTISSFRLPEQGDRKQQKLPQMKGLLADVIASCLSSLEVVGHSQGIFTECASPRVKPQQYF